MWASPLSSYLCIKRLKLLRKYIHTLEIVIVILHVVTYDKMWKQISKVTAPPRTQPFENLMRKILQGPGETQASKEISNK